MPHVFNGPYTAKHLDRIAFPLGGLGAGMICLEGTGALSHVSLRGRPDVYNEPTVFAAVSLKKRGGNLARVLEGPVPTWKLFGPPGTGRGAVGRTYGLPRFRKAEFLARFPFATISLQDRAMPMRATITGWSPFEPGNADGSSLPVAALEYTLTNTSRGRVEGVFSFNARQFIAAEGQAHLIVSARDGVVMRAVAPDGRPWEAGAVSIAAAGGEGCGSVHVNHAWFRGGWFDPMTMAWKDVQDGACYNRPPVSEGGPASGASLFVPFALDSGASTTICVRLCWYVGDSGIRYGDAQDSPAKDENFSGRPSYRPWYAGRFADIGPVAEHWHEHYAELRAASERFSRCFFETSLAPEVVEAVAANLSILKSPTVLRQEDGRLWAWEGCQDTSGCCYGSCTHVWNYAQAIPHLFPALERMLRETEYGVAQDDRGHQSFRVPLPIRTPKHDFHSAADGQLGGLLKLHRDWRISGDREWLAGLWPKAKAGLDYCIATWDPRRTGALEEPHHNTYDIEFWGPDGMCTSLYVASLQAAVAMGTALGEDVSAYAELADKGRAYLEGRLFNGEYFHQKIQWEGLAAEDPTKVQSFGGAYSPEAVELLRKEGPKYQYGNGCLADGIIGAWMAEVCGVGEIAEPAKVRAHLAAVHRYNLKRDLSTHVNPQRPAYACGAEGGLLLCTWPKGGALSIPFIYSNEVWTGIEYQVASHAMACGLVREGLDIVRLCRSRYDGTVRNPFNEYECGHWYARAMASYALLQALAGVRYDAVEKVLHIAPQVAGDFACFLATAEGYGLTGIKNGRPYLDVRCGHIAPREVKYRPVQASSV